MGSDTVGQLILLALKAGAWTLYLLPRGVGLSLGNALGSVLRFFRFRAEVIGRNLERAYPDSVEKRERLFKESYHHLGNLFLEILLVFGPLRSFTRRYASQIGAENWRRAVAGGRGAILLSSHVGNWEVMAATSEWPGMELMLVTKHLKPEWLHRAVERGRLRCKVAGTYEPKTMRDVLKHLKSGKTVGIVMDQYAGPPVGIRVPLFGVPVGTTSVVATLVKRTGAPVLPVVNFRTPDGRYIVDIRPPIPWIRGEGTEELAVNTSRYASILEKDIHDHPEQWLWSHRRFKGDLSPLGESEWAEGRARRSVSTSSHRSPKL